MRFNIINHSSTDLTLAGEPESSGMSKWNGVFPRHIASQKKMIFPIKFGCCKCSNYGVAIYNFATIEKALTITLKNSILSIQWDPAVREEGFWVYPPPLKSGKPWEFKAKKNDAPYSILVMSHEDLPMQAPVTSPEELNEHWMEYLMPVIKDKAIPDLFYPVSHDSASYSIKNKLCGCFAKTQSHSILHQL